MTAKYEKGEIKIDVTDKDDIVYVRAPGKRYKVCGDDCEKKVRTK
jgi:hypothetical protein